MDKVQSLYVISEAAAFSMIGVAPKTKMTPSGPMTVIEKLIAENYTPPASTPTNPLTGGKKAVQLTFPGVYKKPPGFA
ncbi:MAG: hypothetical protein WC654_06595, partial [Patescibacteria group bacterium]